MLFVFADIEKYIWELKILNFSTQNWRVVSLVDSVPCPSNDTTKPKSKNIKPINVVVIVSRFHLFSFLFLSFCFYLQLIFTSGRARGLGERLDVLKIWKEAKGLLRNRWSISETVRAKCFQLVNPNWAGNIWRSRSTGTPWIRIRSQWPHDVVLN